ncbi:hypothetical protein ABNB59_19360 [Paenibacillus larvae]|uniref:Phage protein n=1 Tax=Paenibacillus larvae TaxID=1464 RepID=A0AAP5N3C2_9BACL|nr:hypothetical protein [Paenibacillus larvae]UYE92081.1 hypothetical protein LUNBUN_57 [Paenibacillus phage LunBun]UYE92163.1 hypothetical protein BARRYFOSTERBENICIO_57 [Paenibacillus phage BarryFoster_Benicio]UYL91527.1 hypothetical protein ABATENZ_57 [Paenibacillus phage ABAtENZ]UYL91609.1 hypothetical protein AJG77_57 [Paenibacillus phage AJG77]UYL91691.1 hypothetical protein APIWELLBEING_57 [Paenibacillus phage ApiWellbeing]UYL91773.1 hypothetical protein BLOOMFIELD_57 [Paenibacillus pha
MTKWRLTMVNGRVIELTMGETNYVKQALESLKHPDTSRWIIADEVAINYDHVMLIEFIKSEEE